MLVACSRIFADHFQFYVFDSKYDHFADQNLDWSTAQRRDFGYLVTRCAVYVSTVAPLNSHRVRVFVGEEPRVGYERVFRSQLDIASGVLVISAPANVEEDDLRIEVNPGAYEITICASAVGVDELDILPDSDDPLSDEEFLLRDDLEHYDLYLKPCA